MKGKRPLEITPLNLWSCLSLDGYRALEDWQEGIGVVPALLDDYGDGVWGEGVALEGRRGEEGGRSQGVVAKAEIARAGPGGQR